MPATQRGHDEGGGVVPFIHLDGGGESALNPRLKRG